MLPRVILLSIILSCSSCSAIYDYYYVVINMTDCEISATMEVSDRTSVITIQPRMATTIHTTDHGVEPVGGPFFAPVQQDLLDLKIAKNDTIRYSKDPLYDPNWTFDDGTYMLNVTDDDF